MKNISQETANRLFKVCEQWTTWMESEGSSPPKGVEPFEYENQMMDEMKAAVKAVKTAK